MNFHSHKDITERYLDYIKSLSSRLISATPSDPQIFNCEIEGEEWYESDFESFLKSISTSEPSLYFIFDRSDDVQKTFHAFSDFKKKKFRACPRKNEPSDCMYVGSSLRSIRTRLRQHVGLSEAKSTYALHLRHWLKGSLEIAVINYAVDADVLQVIEDGYALELRPAFGKRGGNNRV